jgi:Ca2+-binding RTX toxin-like protein
VSNPVSGWSLYLREGDDTLVNRGTISGGAITLGDGNDVYDGRGGELGAGVLLEGDSGDDTFILDKKIEVYENVGGGTDTIKATISMSLSSGQLIGQEIENLTLLGHKNINGTGNGLDNMLLGNSGDNKLAGMDGTDTIMGRAGNDRLDGGLGADMLTGGQGSDTFIFKTGYGHDTVTDFQNGHDHIDLSGWAAIKDFQDLEAHHLSVSGNDLVITAGADTLTIEHMAKAQLDASDFVF